MTAEVSKDKRDAMAWRDIDVTTNECWVLMTRHEMVATGDEFFRLKARLIYVLRSVAVPSRAINNQSIVHRHLCVS